MKNRKVLNVRLHIGGLHGKTSYDADQDKVEMELTPIGVIVKALNGKPLERKGKTVDLLLPYPNCTEILVETATDEAPVDLESKRGPGRPPKAA